MARGGHNIKSTEALKATGTLRPDRHANRLTAPSSDAIPSPPGDFDADHRAKWIEVCGHLQAFDILATQDQDSIRQYVMSVILQRKAWDDVCARGQTIIQETSGGGATERVNPSWRVYCDCDKIIKPLREQFGFTPKARQGIQTKPKEVTKVDPMMEIMFGKTKLG